MDKIKGEEYKAVFIAFLLAAGLLYAGIYIPLLLLAVPFVLIYAVARGGLRIGVAAAVLSFVLPGVISVNIAGVLAAAFLPPVFTAGYMIRAKKRFFNSVAASAAAALAGAALSIAAVMLITGRPVVNVIVDYAGANISALGSANISMLYQTVRYIDILTGAITQQAVLATPAAEAVKTMQSMLGDALQMLFITFIGIYSLLGGLLYYTIPRAAVKKKMDVAPNPSFSNYALPKGFWIAFALSYLFALIGESFGWKSFDVIEVTVYNLYVFVFAVQALSFLDFMYRKRNMGSGARTMMHVVSVFVLSFILFWLGIFENVFSLRKRMDERQV